VPNRPSGLRGGWVGGVDPAGGPVTVSVR
jgi:hypothetical protein